MRPGLTPEQQEKLQGIYERDWKLLADVRAHLNMHGRAYINELVNLVDGGQGELRSRRGVMRRILRTLTNNGELESEYVPSPNKAGPGRRYFWLKSEK